MKYSCSARCCFSSVEFALRVREDLTCDQAFLFFVG